MKRVHYISSLFSSQHCKCQVAIALLSVHGGLLNCTNFLCSENVIWHNAAVLPKSQVGIPFHCARRVARDTL